MMKYIKIFFIGLIGVSLGCNDGYIDEITAVDPGADEAAPEVTLTVPQEGMVINSANDLSVVDFEFTVADDIELASVTISLNGTALETFNEFTDYRKLIVEYPYELGTGDYEFTVVARDLNGKETTTTVNFKKVNTIRELMNQAIFHLDFNGDFNDNVNGTTATVVGSPTIEEGAGVDGDAYKGAEGAYLTFPAAGLQSSEFSASFYLNVNASPDRAGILVMGPEDTGNAGYPDVQNNRQNGFRFFREVGAGLQQFKLNLGNGAGDNWFDGGAAARVDPATTEWVHYAFTISGADAKVYINGTVVREGAYPGIDWTGCDVLSVMSGAPRFTGWGHLSDQSMMDELLIYDRLLTAEEVSLLGAL